MKKKLGQVLLYVFFCPGVKNGNRRKRIYYYTILEDFFNFFTIALFNSHPIVQIFTHEKKNTSQMLLFFMIMGRLAVRPTR